MQARVALAIFCLGAVACGAAQRDAPDAPDAPEAAAARAPRSPGAAQRWARPLADYTRDVQEEEEEEELEPAPARRAAPPRAAPGRRRAAPHSLRAIPIELPTECSLRSGQDEYGDDDDYEEADYVPKPTPRRPAARRPPAPRRRPAPPPPPTRDDDYAEPPPRRRPAPRKPPAEPRYPAYLHVDQLDESVTSPVLGVAASSQELLQQFAAQAPAAPQLPPVLLSAHDTSERAPRPADDAETVAAGSPAAAAAAAPGRSYLPLQTSFSTSSGTRGAHSPARPRLARSLRLRGALTVRRADYTETYDAWWDAGSGSARVDFSGGAASTYRSVAADGTVHRLEMRVDRSGEDAVRRCGRAAAAAAAPADRAPPALPDLEPFSFAGYVTLEGGERAERWQHAVSGRAGELGGARGEALSFRHELLLRRAADDAVVPIRYTVGVDSSLLGADCDGYEHRYEAVREQQHDPQLFTPDIGELCDYVEQLNSSSAEHFSRLEPLKEFTLPHRDLRYDEAIERFKRSYGRQYADAAEEALRKNLLMQHVRFTRAANREGATFELAVNFLGDRLDAELEQLLGVRAEPERGRAEPFPHSRAELRAAAPALPERFDWRPRGAVSPVRYQGSCSSCWAFAVAGAVEGALFVRTARLTPLSEKCLVDCAHPFGGNGCKGTWPSHAYDYVQSRGLPARAAYPPYAEQVDACAEPSARPVTRISAHVNVTADSVPALKVAIRKHAPTVVIVDAKAKSFVFYKKGVLYDDRCGKAARRLNHAVLAVGWGARRGDAHFVLKNSWSEAWGERGFVRVQARANTCGVLTRPSYPRLEPADVLPGGGA